MTTREELADINKRFSDALANQDVETLGAFYTDDARALFAGEPIIRGRAEIEAMFRRDLKEGGASIRFESIDVIEDGSLVVDVGRYITPTGTGKYVVVYQRQADGTLKLAVDAATGDGPEPAAT